MKNLENQVLEYFPRKIYNLIFDKIEFAEEIRIRQAKPICIKRSDSNICIDYVVTASDILEIMQRICEYSIYSYQNQISNGYITLKGGHRVGISGSCVIENGKVININYINSLNFRIARQVAGASKNILPEIINQNLIYNTIIVSPPGYGKTTILKDLIKNLSTNLNTINVGVVDERGEISAMYKGLEQNDLGLNVDILENVPKPLGIRMLIRSMAPNVIVVDEIGTKEDVEALKYCFVSGVKGIFTCHGESYEDLLRNPDLKKLFIEEGLIEKIIFLSKEKGKIKEVKNLGETNVFCKID